MFRKKYAVYYNIILGADLHLGKIKNNGYFVIYTQIVITLYGNLFTKLFALETLLIAKLLYLLAE